jgi:hypothetical protein
MTIWLAVNVILVIAYAHAQVQTESRIQEGAADKLLVALGEVSTRKKKKKKNKQRNLQTGRTGSSHRVSRFEMTIVCPTGFTCSMSSVLAM